MPEPRETKRAVVWAGVVMIGLWVVALAVTGVCFVTVSESARQAADGTLVPGGFLGIPLFEGFHEAGRFGVRPQWGLLVMLLVPAAAGIAVAAGALARMRSRA